MGFLAMPVAPDAIFLAANDVDVAKRMAAMDPTVLVRELNLLVAGRANGFVWGTNDRQMGFVRKRFRKTPLPPAVSDEQQNRAIAAARGRQ